jgi:hypothetical protein
MDKPTNTPPRYNDTKGQRLAIMHRLASGLQSTPARRTGATAT